MKEAPMVRDPEAYTVVGRIPGAVVGHTAFCEHCKNPVFDRAIYSRDPALRQRARRGWVVLTDRMYVGGFSLDREDVVAVLLGNPADRSQEETAAPKDRRH
jgi:hypothetical protein